jgi:transcriptional regulator with XRE-family HTH domain
VNDALLIARRNARLTQAQIHDITGIDRSRYSRIELEKAVPSIYEAYAIADAVGADIKTIFLSVNANEMRKNSDCQSDMPERKSVLEQSDCPTLKW